MKLTKAIVVCSIVCLIPSIAAAQTAQDIIAKAIAAEGGAARAQFNTQMAKGTISIPAQGLDGEFLSYNMRPNRVYVNISLMGMELIQATDGSVCWGVNPFAGATEPTVMPEAQATAMLRGADFDGAYYNLEAKGITAELVGTETIDGTETNCVRLTYKDGHTSDFFFASDTGLLMRTKEMQDGQMGMAENVVTFSDYRDVQGVKVPHSIVQSQGGMEILIDFDEIVPNADVDASIFSMPQPEVTK